MSIETKSETISELLSAKAAEHSDRMAYRFLEDGYEEAGTLTYGQLDLQARALAARIQEVCAPGDRALITSAPAIDFIRAFMACQHAGVIAVPAPSPLPIGAGTRVATLAGIASDCAAAAVLTGGGTALRQKLSEPAPGLAALAWLDSGDFDETAAQSFQPALTRPDDLCFLQYTSGSTSQPKGVMVSHRNWTRNADYYVRCMGLGQDEIFVSWMPLFHDFGLIGQVLASFYLGAQAVLMPPTAFVQSPKRWLQAVTRYGGTMIGSPNFGYNMCNERIPEKDRAGLDLSSLKIAVTGAEPIRPATLEAFAVNFAPHGFDPATAYPAYGLAEITLLATGGVRGAGPTLFSADSGKLRDGWLCPGDDRILVGVGSARYDRRLAIVDPKTRLRVEPGRVGEIWLGGPDVAAGYWERPQESERTMNARLAHDDDGPYLRTGDLGVLYDGELYVAGRLKDIIIIDGHNYYPQDIEATVEGVHSWIRNGCTAAFPVERDGRERLVVVAEVMRPGASRSPGSTDTQPDPRVLARLVRTAVAGEHGIVVSDVALVVPRSVPKTTSGKLQRKACRAAYEREELIRIPADA